MDDQDLVSQYHSHHCTFYHISQGVVVCVTSLVMALAQDHLEAFAVCYTKAVDRLHKVNNLVHLYNY